MEVILSSDSELKKNPQRFIAKKNHDKIKKYLISFNLKVVDCIDKDSKAVAKNMAKQRKKFNDAKKAKMTPRAFKTYETSENYDHDLEAHYDNEEAKANFEGFEGDTQHFLPIAAAVGKRLLKGGIKLIKNKLAKKRASKEAAQTPSDTNAVFAKTRDNIQSVGLDAWMNDAKKQQIDKLIARGKQEDLNRRIEAGLIKAGVSPSRFRHFQSIDGNYDAPKVKDILSDILQHEKAGETAKGTMEAMPKIIILVVIAFITGMIIHKIA